MTAFPFHDGTRLIIERDDSIIAEALSPQPDLLESMRRSAKGRRGMVPLLTPSGRPTRALVLLYTGFDEPEQNGLVLFIALPGVGLASEALERIYAGLPSALTRAAADRN